MNPYHISRLQDALLPLQQPSRGGFILLTRDEAREIMEAAESLMVGARQDIEVEAAVEA